MGMPFAPTSSFGRAALGDDGTANKLFLTYLFINMDIGIQFLRDMGLIHRQMSCNTCSRDMTWCVQSQSKVGFIWACRRHAATVCNQFKFAKHRSWFQHSNLTFQQVLYLTYNIMWREPATRIKQEHRFSVTTISNWGQFCRETMLAYLQVCTQKIGGPNKIFEIDESKFGRRKYNRDHLVMGQWVFGGIERNSGITFFVPVLNGFADTLVGVIHDRIEPGTTVISDCWGAYQNLDQEGYTHLTLLPEPIQIQLSASRGTRRQNLTPITGSMTTYTTWHTTRLRRGATRTLTSSHNSNYIHNLWHLS
jgi:transposase-like protein